MGEDKKWFVHPEGKPDQPYFHTPWDPAGHIPALMEIYRAGEKAGREAARKEVLAALGLKDHSPAVSGIEIRVSELATRVDSLRGRSMGFVYLFFCAETGESKIGFSVDPEKRRKGIEKEVGSPVELLCSIPTIDMRHGEWFKLTPEQRASIIGMAEPES